MTAGVPGRVRRARRVAAGAALVACAACAGEERVGAVGEAARPSYSVRLDNATVEVEAFHLVEDDDGIRIQTGPAGIAYRADDLVEDGGFTLEATFVQYDAPVAYREAYGIFVGGRDLTGVGQEYTYLLVRSTGDYLVKRRIGDATETLVDWAAHDAVDRVVEEGDMPRNRLGIEVSDAEVRFTVNGAVVHTSETARVRPHGVAGVRVNHRLDVRVDDWLLAPAAPDS